MNTTLDFTTRKGFFCTYFELLKVSQSKFAAFNFLNSQVESITGKKLYKNYSSFEKRRFK